MPTLQATRVELTARQEVILKQVVRRHTSPQRLVKRAKILLYAAQGQSNSQIARKMGIVRNTVILWRGRWREASVGLKALETEETEEKPLREAIADVLDDAPRPGSPGKFSAEQVVQILALACEDPQLSERPISHWSARELADEAGQRGIVESISPQQVDRFLKSGGFAAPS
jgi:transposase